MKGNRLSVGARALRWNLPKVMRHHVGALLMTFLAIFAFVGSVVAQTPATTVSGVVKDSNGAPLVGVTILEKGTGRGATTDAAGKYRVHVAGVKSVLQFSFIGYESKEESVGNRTAIDVVLSDAATMIDELVVVGYGTMRKRDLTGSVSKVNMDTKSTFVNTNVLQSLQGAIAGLNVGMTTGAGSIPEFTIRSNTSISASNNPLVVVDGAIYNGYITDFAPADILSVDVLKDASSAAVYGSRAANGVVLITTRMGSSEKPQLRFNAYLGVNSATNKPKMLNGEQYIQKILDYRIAQGLDADPEKIPGYLNAAEVENWQNGRTIDPYDEVIRTGVVQNYDLSISGRTKFVNYFTSFNYNTQKGVVLGDDYERFGLRVNLEANITDWFKAGVKFNFVTNDYSGKSADLVSANYMSPFGQYYDSDGEMIRYPMGDQLITNPLAPYYQEQDKDIRRSLFGIVYAEVEAPFLRGLKYKISYSDNYRWSDTASFLGADTYGGAASNGKGSQSRGFANDYILDNIVSFDRTFGRHHVNATLLYSYEHNEGNSVTAAASNFSSSILGWNALGTGTVQTVASSAYDDNSISQMVRLHYGYDSRYLATFTLRRDGCSRFGADNKFGLFPSVALAWVISREKFMEKAAWIDNLKLRASYGLNGNQAVSRYASLATIGSNRYVEGSNPIITLFTNSMANAQLGWESTRTLNFGLDFALWKSRLTGSIEVYHSNSKDLLLLQSLPYMTGFGSVWANVGQVKNRGVEVTLSSVNIQHPNFRWTTDVTFSRYRNEITHLYGTDKDGDGKEDDDVGNRWFIGHPINSFYGYQTDGIYQTGEDIPDGFKPGYFRIKDLDGIEGIDPTGDQSVYAYADPSYRFSINNTFTYKNVSLAVMINSIQGGKDYYKADNSYALNPAAYFPDRLNIVDIPYWTPDRASDKYPTINYKPAYGHYFLQSRSFVRIQDISLAYTFSKSLIGKIGMEGLRVYFSAKNPWTFTKWVGYDPEAGQSVFYGTPSMRSFVFGINITF